MSQKHLNYTYFIKKDGMIDDLVYNLGDCSLFPAFFSFRDKCADYENYIDLFLNDITIIMSQSEDEEIKEISFNENTFSRKAISFKLSQSKNSEAYYELENQLDKGEIVGVRTVCEMLPHSTYFQENYDMRKFEPGHLFSVIHHDKDVFYFVESPDLLVEKYLTLYEENVQIGLLDKKLAREVFNNFCNIYTYSINHDELKNCKLHFNNCIQNSIVNYSKATEKKDGKLIYYGRNSILRLIELCEREIICFNAEHSSGKNYYDYFGWKIWCIKSYRRMLLDCIANKKNSLKEVDFSEIEKTILNSISLWNKVYLLFGKNYFQGLHRLDCKYKERFTEILKAEDKIIQQLEVIDASSL